MCQCGSGCTNSCSCSNEKVFTSQINYDGNLLPCIDNNINVPYYALNELLFQINERICELNATAAQGPAGADGAAGVGISNIAWTSNSGGQPQGTQGTTDTYTITLTDASTYNFVVTNGADGITGQSCEWQDWNATHISLTNNGGIAPTLISASIRSRRIDNAAGTFAFLGLDGSVTFTATGIIGDRLQFDINIGTILSSLGLTTNSTDSTDSFCFFDDSLGNEEAKFARLGYQASGNRLRVYPLVLNEALPTAGQMRVSFQINIRSTI